MKRSLLWASAIVAVAGGILVSLWLKHAGISGFGFAPATSTATTTACCGGDTMQVEGDAHVWEVPEGKLGDGRMVPEGYRVEVFGNVMVVKGVVAAGKYRVEVLGSENAFDATGKRVFDVAVVTSAAATGAAATRQAGAGDDMTTIIGKDVDLFALAGGMGKPYVVKGEVMHGGGMMKVVLTGKVDQAKFSGIKIIDIGSGMEKKVAWVFAEDAGAMLKLPGEVPVVAGAVVWKDTGAPFEVRVADLVKRMSLREKIWQLSHTAPAITRLGLPGYNYWNEALHGVARNGVATVFPQAIGMGASFDPVLMKQVGDVISTEARAKYNGWQAAGADMSNGGAYQCLTFWSPNINLFRDPRWGRGQETYGEDPLLTGKMGVAFIQGLQGDDSKYYKVVATAKHFAVHSGPELLRHEFDARPPERDLYESYLPQFEMAVREGKVASVMGAYNRVYGEPACASDLLLEKTLRGEWGFDGYVVSDCGAITDIWAHHKVMGNEAAAAADAVLAGCDLECGTNYGSLGAAVDLKMIDEKAIDRALARVLLSRFRLGLFDPPSQVKWAGIKATENDTSEHAALALKMARESIVLLKNNGVLPLDARRIKKIAVVGPNGDGLLGLLGNYNGTPSKPVTVVEGLRAAMAKMGGEVAFVKGCDNAEREGEWQLVPDVCLRPARAAVETGMKAEWFGDEAMKEKLSEGVEKSIDFHGTVEWTVPVRGAKAVRWSGEFVAPADGEYRLGILGVSGFRWRVEGKVVADAWEKGMAEAGSVGNIRIVLKKGEAVGFELEGKATWGQLDLTMLWNRGDLDLTGEVAARVKDADVIVFAGGLDGHMEAEESDVRALYKGFVGGDREVIELPGAQTAMMKALVATGKPVVFVNMTGSAVAMPWEEERVGAIVQGWYPGQSGGKAIADVLFGEYNPGGRLPVTFYKGTAELPSFKDYAMEAGAREGGLVSKGRTYRYFNGGAEWVFGHGLSYTQFRYDKIMLNNEEIKAQNPFKVNMDVTNIGKRDGDEVVQVYARQANADNTLRRLVGFERVAIATGETKHVAITGSLAALRDWDEQRKTYHEARGRYIITVGGSSADIKETIELTIP